MSGNNISKNLLESTSSGTRKISESNGKRGHSLGKMGSLMTK